MVRLERRFYLSSVRRMALSSFRISTGQYQLFGFQVVKIVASLNETMNVSIIGIGYESNTVKTLRRL